MVWTKAKTAIVGVGLLLAAGTAFVTIKKSETNRLEVWQRKYDLAGLAEIPPQVRLVPTTSSILFRPGSGWGGNAHGMMGLGVKAIDVVQSAYGVTLGRMIVSTPLPDGNFDFVSNLPQNADKALQQEVRDKFGLTARRERMDANVLVLTVRHAAASGLRPTSVRINETTSNRDYVAGSYDGTNLPISNLVEYLEGYLKTPVVDRTGITGRFDMDLKGSSTPEGLKHVVLHELGLDLVPGRESIEFLIVEKAH